MLLSNGPIEEFSSCCSPPAIDIDLSSSWLFSEFYSDPFSFWESVSEPAPRNRHLFTFASDFFFLLRIRTAQFIVDMDDDIESEESKQATSLHEAVEVNSGIVGEMRGAEIEIPRHFRYVLYYVYILENFI